MDFLFSPQIVCFVSLLGGMFWAAFMIVAVEYYLPLQPAKSDYIRPVILIGILFLVVLLLTGVGK